MPPHSLSSHVSSCTFSVFSAPALFILGAPHETGVGLAMSGVSGRAEVRMGVSRARLTSSSSVGSSRAEPIGLRPKRQLWLLSPRAARTTSLGGASSPPLLALPSSLPRTTARFRALCLSARWPRVKRAWARDGLGSNVPGREMASGSTCLGARWPRGRRAWARWPRGQTCLGVGGSYEPGRHCVYLPPLYCTICCSSRCAMARSRSMRCFSR